ncbi:MAG: PRD domain-containing protein [Erysipelotrichaceae bacterium]|nr:PRD domain-containing protein [Erysipelotrichaceae bacterium]
MSNYKINKILNHNVILVNDTENQEWILFGRGIGFSKQINDFIDNEKVENKYALFDSKKLGQYQSLIEISNEDATIMSEWIISEMKKRFGVSYNSYVHISLLDHLNFALKRIKGNIVIQNLFESELASIYKKEYEFSLEMVNKIRKELNIELPDSEAGMICLHIHSALHDEKVSNTALIMNVVSYTVRYLENKYGKVEEGLIKNRLIIHLKFAIKRTIEKVTLCNDLNDVIKIRYSKSFEASRDLSNKIFENFYLRLDESEISYLAIHLQNIFHFEKCE